MNRFSGFSRFNGFSGFTGLALALAVSACSKAPESTPAAASSKPSDAQHAGITTPHGDHAPHHGGMVLMNGEVHYEVVFDRDGRHQVWFSDAVREDLPASIAKDVRMLVTRTGAAPEAISLAIDDSGESWIAKGQPVVGDDVMVKVSYSLKGEPFVVEIPFVVPGK